jgi:formylglycine-generating enzyme required for sulfatase activity
MIKLRDFTHIKLLLISGGVLLALGLVCLLFYLPLISVIRANYGDLIIIDSRDPGNPALAKLAHLTTVSIDKLNATRLRYLRDAKVSPTDEMVMVYVPAGEFKMGGARHPDTRPLRKVYLDDYWIDSTEVSNTMYARCVGDGVCDLPAKVKSLDSFIAQTELLDHPVIYVTWFDAIVYCRWAGRRLPTEAEWEKAARGVDGRVYPWGFWEPDPNLLNYGNLIGTTVPVNRFPFGASPYGALNMAGNVREWVGDWYGEYYYRQAPDHNPQGPEHGEERVLRGGGFADTNRRVRANNRFKHVPDSPGYNRGFRCAQSP